MSDNRAINYFDDDDDDLQLDSHGRSGSPGRESSSYALEDSYATSTSPSRARDRDSSVRREYWDDSSSVRRGAERDDSVALENILGEGFGGVKERNVERLMRAWENESHAPELLVFPRELVETVVKDLARKRALIKKYNLVTKDENGVPFEEGFYVSKAIVATENMRASHVLKEFTRMRIFKVEKFARYYLNELALAETGESDDPDIGVRLYHNEIAHAQGYVALTDDYFKKAAVDAMPEKVSGRLADVGAHPTPDFSQPVFVKPKRNCGPVIVPNGADVRLQKDKIEMMRYSSVRELLRRGDVDLV